MPAQPVPTTGGGGGSAGLKLGYTYSELGRPQQQQPCSRRRRLLSNASPVKSVGGLFLAAALTLALATTGGVRAQQQQQPPQDVQALYRRPLCLFAACEGAASAPNPAAAAAASPIKQQEQQEQQQQQQQQQQQEQAPPPPPQPASAATGHPLPTGVVYYVEWSEARQGYVLGNYSSAASPSPSSGPRVLLANATAVDASAGASGWNQLAVAAAPVSAWEGVGGGGDGETEKASPIKWMLRAWYAAGLLEGYLTAPLIADYAKNIRAAIFDTRYPSEHLLNFLDDNGRWMRAQVNAHVLQTDADILFRLQQQQQQQPQQQQPPQQDGQQPQPPLKHDDPAVVEAEAWLGTAAVLAQFEGLVAGYQASATGQARPLTERELLFVNAYGDLFDLTHRYFLEDDPPLDQARLRTAAVPGPGSEGALDTSWFWTPVALRTDDGEEAASSEGGKELLRLPAGGAEEDKAAAEFEAHEDDRCTVLIKGVGQQADGSEDVLMAHTTFDYYIAAWQRLVKDTALPVLLLSGDGAGAGGNSTSAQQQQQQSPVARQAFSASAGQLASLDDFYLVRGEGRGLEGKQLVVSETTIMMKKAHRQLVDLFTPESLLYWVRVSVANAWARDGAHWAQLFAFGNSGTYNCEWMVLDPPHRKLWVLDQAPLKAEAIDRSSSIYPPPAAAAAPAAATDKQQQQLLLHESGSGRRVLQAQEQQPREDLGSGVSQGYFGSHNVPSDKAVYDYLGFGLKDPASLKYQLERFQGAPRSQLLAANQGRVKDVESMKEVIQYNGWQRDPLSLGHPLIAIAGRGDLEDPKVNGSLYKMDGAIDAKVVSVSEAFGGPHLQLHGRIGMTTDGQKPFCWKDHPDFTPGVGTPACFDFKWERLSPGQVLADALRSLQSPPATGKGKGKKGGRRGKARSLLRGSDGGAEE